MADGTALDPVPLPRPDPRKGIEMGQIERPYHVYPTPKNPFLPHWYNSEQQQSELSAGINRHAYAGQAAENQTKGAIHPETLLQLLGILVPEGTLGDANRISPSDVYQGRFRYSGQDL